VPILQVAQQPLVGSYVNGTGQPVVPRDIAGMFILKQTNNHPLTASTIKSTECLTQVQNAQFTADALHLFDNVTLQECLCRCVSSGQLYSIQCASVQFDGDKRVWYDVWIYGLFML
jgi:hypothetical protein